SDWLLERAKFLLKNTHVPLNIRADTTLDGFLAQMRGECVRWESLGIFITAATRAALDTISFPPLYSNEGQRRTLITALTALGDSCLEKCLAVDFLNGLQLMLQYENFIVHSQVEGDQSKCSGDGGESFSSNTAYQVITASGGWATSPAPSSPLDTTKE